MKRAVIVVLGVCLTIGGHLRAQSGAAEFTYELLHTFAGMGDGSTPADGDTPAGRVLLASDGHFYGTTLFGGPYDLGTVYRLTKDGQVETVVAFGEVLNEVTGEMNGAFPSGGLVEFQGELYGTTESGGPFGEGSVYRVNLETGGLTEVATFDSFAGTGAIPMGGLVVANGSLWGTTTLGSCSPETFECNNLGTVFNVSLETGLLTTVYQFTTETGANPVSGLTRAPNGDLYGVTLGDEISGPIPSTLFKVSSTDGSFELLTSFNGADQGRSPATRPLITADGILYGTTTQGGSGDQGVIYRFDPATNALSTVTDFSSTSSAGAFGAGLVEVNGTLYGTANNGGSAASAGIVYRLDGNLIVPIHHFDGISGLLPNNTLIAADGALYGTTGAPERGTIFRIVLAQEDAATLALEPAQATYGGVAGLKATLSSSSGPIAGAQVDFTLNGMSIPAITDDAGVATVSVSVAGLSAGTYPAAISATSAAVPDVTATADLIVGRAIPTVTVAGGTFVYDTEAHPATARVRGITGEELAGAVTFTYNGSADLPVDPRTYNVIATYAGNENYLEGTGAGTITIVPAPAGVTGLIAAYGFNEGGGNIAADSSTRNHDGIIRGATYVPGKFGKALSFDGVRDWVSVGDHSDLDVRNGVTMMAWVNPRELSGSNTILMKETRNSLAYALSATDSASHGVVNISGDQKSVSSLGALAPNTWTHIAVTYSGTNLRFYVNGVEVNKRALSGRIAIGNGELRIGGNSVWDDQFFNGLIDEVRIYGSAISQADIQRDMIMPVAHEFQAPTVSITSPLGGAELRGMPLITASASDNVAVASVQFEVDGKMIAKSVADAPYTMRLDAANGAHVVRALARDTAGNSAWSAPVTITIANKRVADFRFNETAGAVALDGSGMGNNGNMSAGVTRALDAERGKVLQFNGSGGIITVADSDSLDLKAGLTLEAWVKPSALGGWRTVMFKEGDGILPRYVLNANDFTPTPAAYLHIDFIPDGIRSERKLELNQWAHLAVTYDGETIRLFVNGEEKESRTESGPIRISEGRLLIGGTTWGQWFKGLMDDVRIYDVAVAESQIKADMKEAIE
jgi:uncharacterized repeat protein (TIGR03803 family)